jgi:hypothetical protein
MISMIAPTRRAASVANTGKNASNRELSRDFIDYKASAGHILEMIRENFYKHDRMNPSGNQRASSV